MSRGSPALVGLEQARVEALPGQALDLGGELGRELLHGHRGERTRIEELSVAIGGHGLQRET